MLGAWPELVNEAASLGVVGLLFIMWWHERQERVRSATWMRDAQSVSEVVNAANARLLDVVRANTEAVTALREELRSQRSAAGEWLNRLERQLEALDA